MWRSFKRSLLAATVLACALGRRQNFGLHLQIHALGNDSILLENESSNESLLTVESTKSGSSFVDHRSVSDRTVSAQKVSKLLGEADKNMTAENDSSGRASDELQEKAKHNSSDVLTSGVLSTSGSQEEPGTNSSTLWFAAALGIVLGWCCCISLMHAQGAQNEESGSGSGTKKGKRNVNIFNRAATEDDESDNEDSHSPPDRGMFRNHTTRLKKKAVKFVT